MTDEHEQTQAQAQSATGPTPPAASWDAGTADATAAGPSGPTDAAVASATPHAGGWAIPGYDVTGEIARGGMGAVLSARDRTLNRDVAIKVLLPDRPASADSVRRFVVEAHITAKLPHPGIPPVHQLGTLPDGKPFLAMKLIKGETLAKLLADPDRGRRGGADFVQVFEQICQAVGFAHSVGVIHRDLKPLNVMVGAFGEVQVMDWGLAKDVANPERERRGSSTPPSASASEGSSYPVAHAPGSPAGASQDTEMTLAGQAMGTPAYMPPEQARGDWANVGPRSDVFALGGILKAILTGKAPYSGASAMDTVKKAALADLGEARDRLAGCGADAGLVGIAVRCLDPDPANRPADAAAVAGLIAAYRQGVADRLRKAEADRAAADAKAVEQRKKRKAQLALAAAVALLLAAGGGFAWYSDRQASTAKLKQAEYDAEQAQVRFDAEQRAAADRERVGRNAEAIAGLLTECEDALRDDDARKAAPLLAAAEKRAAEGGADALAGRLARGRADLDVLRELDRIDDFRWTQTNGEYPPRVARATRWEAAFASAGMPLPMDRGRASDIFARSSIRTRLLLAAELWFVYSDGDTRRQLQSLLAGVDPDPFRDALRAAVEAKDWDRTRALAAEPAALQQPPRTALVIGLITAVSAERRESLLQGAANRQPRDYGVLMALGELYTTDVPETAAARQTWFRAAVTARPGSETAWNNLGWAYTDGSWHSTAAECFRYAARLMPTSAVPQSNLGLALQRQGRLDEALAACREAIRRNPAYAPAYSNLSSVLNDQGDQDAASTTIREAIRLDPKVALYHYNLGAVLWDKRDVEGTIAATREAIQLDPAYSAAHNQLGLALRKQGDLAAAIAAFREAIRLKPTEPKYYFNLGLARKDEGKPAEAAAAYREAIRLNPRFALAHYNLGHVLRDQGEFAAALAAFRAAARIDPKSSNVQYMLGLTQAKLGDTAGAITSLREAVRLDPKSAISHNQLGKVLYSAGDYTAARGAIAAAVRLEPDDQAYLDNLKAVDQKILETSGRVAPPPRPVTRP